MRIDLTGKTALVTGSTQGIGAAIATGLARAGARVADHIRAEQPEADLVATPGDIATEAGAGQVVDAAPEVDILINNLGVFEARPALAISDDEWRRYFEVNVLAAVRLTRSYLPGMMQRSWGRVQNIASDSAIVIPAEMIHYGVSKTALLGVSRGFAKEAAGSGVTVNSVIAGPTHSAGVRNFVYELVDPELPWEQAQREFMRRHRPQSLLQRLIEPDEIANMVVYLSSPFASATTGAALRVDGGYIDSIVP